MQHGRIKQKFISVGVIDLLAPNAQGTPIQIKTPRPIVALHLIGRVTNLNGTGAGVVEDAVNRYFRQIRLTNGGSPIQTIGDGSPGASAFQMLEPIVRGWLRAVPHVTQILAADSTALVHTVMPIATPPNLYGRMAVDRSALRIGNASTWFVEADSGSIADLITTPGTAAITAASLEVIAEVDDDLAVDTPPNSFMMFSNFQAQDIGTAAATNRVFELSANGIVLFAGYQQRNNSLRSRTIITDLQFRLNGSQIVLEGTWDLFEHLLEFFGDAAANAPVGLAAAPFDNTFTLRGIPAAGSTGWDLLITNGIGAGDAQDGLNGQYYYVRPTNL